LCHSDKADKRIWQEKQTLEEMMNTINDNTQKDVTLTVTIPKSVYDRLIKTSTDMARQDNKATARPYYYLVEYKKFVPSPSHCADKMSWVDNENSAAGEMDDKEMVEHIKEVITNPEELETYGVLTSIDQLSVKNLINFINGAIYDGDYLCDRFVKVYHQAYWERKNVFFTHNGYKEHMKLNQHNYPEDAHSYIDYAELNSEMEAVQQLLLALTGNINVYGK
jgi:hypothetical protein